jgi:spermidine synthase
LPRTRTLHQAQGAHGPLVVQQIGTRRELHFANDITQTLIDLEHPGYLPLAANRAMLAHLAFGQRPRNVLLAGCGGGAIARWFAAHSPQTHGTAVELDPQVASLARRYFEFPSDWQLKVADVRDHLAGCKADYDFILVDIEVGGHTPRWVGDPAFVRQCRDALTPAGVITFNLVAEQREGFVQKLATIQGVFGKRTLCLSIPQHDNVLVLAFRRRPDLSRLAQRLPSRAARWALELPELVKRMRRENPPGSGIL